MTQPCNYVNFVEMIQAAVVMMPFGVGNKMRNGAALLGWSLLEESAETTRPFSFAAHFLISRNLAIFCWGRF